MMSDLISNDPGAGRGPAGRAGQIEAGWASLPEPTWDQVPQVPEAAGKGPVASPIIGVLVAGGATALLWSSGHHHAAIAVGATAASLTGAVLVSPRARAAIVRTSAWLAHVVGRVLTVLLLGAVYYAIITPTALFLRLLRRDPLASRPDRKKATYWEEVPVSEGRALDRRQFTLECQPRRRRGLGMPYAVASFACFLLVLNTLVGVYLRDHIRFDVDRPPRTPGWDASASWYDDYVAENNRLPRSGYDPFTGWRRPDFEGKYFSITGGVRKTYRPAALTGGNGLRVAVFGGSTTWGFGARDLYTVPSQLARVAEQAGILLDVTNFGEVGYNAWQETILLSEVLSGARPDLARPDLVVFYDGINELTTQMVEGPTDRPAHMRTSRMGRILRTHEELSNPWRSNSAVHILQKWWDQPPAAWFDRRPRASSDDYARAIALQYDSAMEVASRLLESYGIPSVQFWQPTILTKLPLDPGEEIFIQGYFDEHSTVYRKATEKIRPETVRLTRALDRAVGPVFIDPAHLNEQGNHMIATAMFTELAPTLREIERRKRGPAR